MRRTLLILIAIAIVAVAGLWAYQNYFPSPQETEEIREEATVTRGTLVVFVNTTGTILPEKQTTLSFKNPGRVAEVLVTEGQSVSAGEVLARLETSDLEFAIAQAEMALASAQNQLLRIQQGPAEYDIAAAQAALQSAQAAYDRLVSGPTQEEVRVARANLDQALANLEQAQAAYDQVADRPNVAMLPQALQLEQATIAAEVAQANFDLTMREPSAAERAAARSNIVQAEAALARLQEGVADEDLRASQLQVEQAQLSLDQAVHQLDGTELTAPHAGTITLVGIKEGELSGGQPAFFLTDLSQYHIEVTVDEIDIGRVAEGQAVTITLDALPDETLSGYVDHIADTAQLDTGVVTYAVTIRLNPTTAPLRVGMTTNVDIVTEERDDVLLVPNRFIRIDRTTGQAFVERAQGDQVQPTEIQIGLRDETSSEVLAGLEEGDTVVLVQQSSQEQLRSMMGPPQ
ncbi:MAG: efflux RND transporter periplasmic adaptor subunit [Anaerolineae bacterium]|jgi:HlyD family secretion protein